MNTIDAINNPDPTIIKAEIELVETEIFPYGNKSYITQCGQFLVFQLPLSIPIPQRALL